jgi:glucose/mannose transport system substrate-binding protein
MRQRIGLAVWLLGAVTACAGENGESSDVQGQLTVQTWFGDEQQQQAYDALFSEFATHYPKVEILTTDSAAESRELFQERLVSGQPNYDTFAFNVSQYVGTELANLDALAAREGFSDAFGDDILRAFTLDGSLRAVPVSVLRVNTMIYSPGLLSEVGISAPPQSLAELTAACEVLEAAGRVCLALSDAGGWTATLWIMDGVFPAVAGAEHSRSFLRGELSGDDALFVQTLETVAALLPYANQDRGDLEWDAAARLVSTRLAAFNPVGEWVRTSPGADVGGVIGTDFELMPHPGTDALYVRNVEAFAATADPNKSRVVEAWLGVVASEAGQTAYNAPLATIPARRLEDLSAFDVYAQGSIEAYADPGTEKVDALWRLVPTDVEGQVNEVLRAFVLDGDVATASAWFAENYALFQR